MKKLLLICLVFSMVSCDHFKTVVKSNTEFDSTKMKTDINHIFDSMHMAFKAKNLNNMLSYLADDGKYMGTDPGENWTKKQLDDYMIKAFNDTSKVDYTINDRTILPDDDGNSAIVIEQYFINVLSSKMMVRGVARTDLKDGRWLIDFYSWNLIPKNEDLKKLNDALEK